MGFRASTSPVSASTFSGKCLVAMIQFLFGIVGFLWKSRMQKAAEKLEECPAYMSADQVLFLGYKYYYKEPDYTEHLRRHFEHQRSIMYERNQISSDLKPIMSFSIGGDLMPYRILKKSTPAEFWKETGPWFFGSDLVFANLETPVYEKQAASDVPEVMLNDMYFNADQQYFRLFNGGNAFGKGFSVLSVANNHTMDQGQEGLRATLSFLKNKGISAIGASEGEQLPFWLTHCEGVKISFHAFTFSLNKCRPPEDPSLRVNYLRLNLPNADLNPVLDEIHQARALGSEFPVLYLHMGNAYTPYPQDHIRSNLSRLAELSGVPIIICGHGHNVQPAEWMGQTLVFHSLGDFVGYDIYKGCRFPLMLRFQLFRKESGDLTFTFEPRIGFLSENSNAQIQMSFVQDGDEEVLKRIPVFRDWFRQHRYLFNFLPPQ